MTDAGAAYRAGAFFGDAVPAGWPDITGLLPDGRFFGVECKAPGRRQSVVQKAMQHEIRRRGGIYVLARSAEDLRKGIEDSDADSVCDDDTACFGRTCPDTRR